MLLTPDLELDSTVEFLKFRIEKAIENETLQLPSKAMEKIQELLSDEKITSEKLIMELKPILASTNNFSWKIQLYLNNLANNLLDQFNIFSFRQLSLFIFIFFFLLLLYKKFEKIPKIKKLEKKANLIFKNGLVRFGAAMGYFIPYLTICIYYIPYLISSYPSLRFFIQSPIKESMVFYNSIPWSGSLYFFGVMFIFTRSQIIGNRFVRFHFTKGLLFFSLQAIPEICYQILTQAQEREYGFDEHKQLSLFLFALNLFWILPGFWEGLTLSYPKNYLLREAIEVNLGRDNDDNFKWWDK